jgi:hypothetical protein
VGSGGCEEGRGGGQTGDCYESEFHGLKVKRVSDREFYVVLVKSMRFQ